MESINTQIHEGKKATAVPAPVTHVTSDSTQEEAGRPQSGQKYTYVRKWRKLKHFEWSCCFHNYRITDLLLGTQVPECISASWYLIGIVHLVIVKTHFLVRSLAQKHPYYRKEDKRVSKRETMFLFVKFSH